MPSEHENATTPLPDSARGGYGNRFEEDAFDYPSPSPLPSQSWSSEDGPTGSAETTVADAQSEAEASGSRRSRARDESGWRQTAVRHRSALTAVATLVLLGGFGLALSTVSDTVTSNPTPGSTAQVSAPKSPGSPSLPSDATLPAEPPGGTANTATPPTQTALPPVTGDRGDDHHGEEERGREDGDHADD
ncbi:hypothetical protein [Streptomyces sp. NPDC001435]|uniref:hypothetical protein n=1 Tax=Streptomyces sp. NPDC001435 TaxID=3364576 RepID=UPI0036A96C35